MDEGQGKPVEVYLDSRTNWLQFRLKSSAGVIPLKSGIGIELDLEIPPALFKSTDLSRAACNVKNHIKCVTYL